MILVHLCHKTNLVKVCFAGTDSVRLFCRGHGTTQKSQPYPYSVGTIPDPVCFVPFWLFLIFDIPFCFYCEFDLSFPLTLCLQGMHMLRQKSQNAGDGFSVFFCLMFAPIYHAHEKRKRKKKVYTQHSK